MEWPPLYGIDVSHINEAGEAPLHPKSNNGFVALRDGAIA